MSTTPQFDLHPDAESLSAFAEHQLPEHERQPILAHLAICAHCRQILFLAQDAVEEAQPAIAGPVLLASPKKPLANWRYAWGALAACAALATVSIVLYPRHPATSPQQAKIAAPHQTPSNPVAAPPAEEKRPLRQAEPRQAAAPAKSIAVPAPAPATSMDSAAAEGAAIPATQQPAKQEQATAGSSNTLNITLKPAQTSETVTVSADSAQIQPEAPPVTETMNAQVVQPKDQIDLKSRSMQPAGAARSAQKSPAVSGGTGNGMTHGVGGSIHAGATGGPVASAAVPARSPSSFAKMAQRPTAVSPEDEAAAHAVLGKILPSGLAAIATAAASHHLLAIDSGGSLFLSEDAGAVWEPVASQWAGRAVLVLTPSAAAGQSSGLAIVSNATADQPAPTAAAPAAPSAALFEIVTDQGVHWTSPDGRTWKTK